MLQFLLIILKVKTENQNQNLNKIDILNQNIIDIHPKEGKVVAN